MRVASTLLTSGTVSVFSLIVSISIENGITGISSCEDKAKRGTLPSAARACADYSLQGLRSDIVFFLRRAKQVQVDESCE